MERMYRIHAIAWVSLCVAFALHVWDEAAHDFLSVYNPAVLRIREVVPLLPLPTFTFHLWLIGLIAAVIILSALTLFALKGVRWLRPIALFYAGIMILNGIGHAAGSFYMGDFMPGVYSSPVLFVAGVFLFVTTRRLP